jgi:acyl carrier protein
MSVSRERTAMVVFDAIAEVAPDRVDGLDGLAADADIWQALDLDSIDHLTIMNRLAVELGRDIPERDYPRLLSLQQLVDYLDGRAG